MRGAKVRAQGCGQVYEFGGWWVDSDRRELLKHGVAVPISARAFEIIEALVQSAGELVTKDDLMDRVWPDASVSENTLQVHISAIPKALGPDRRMLKTASRHGYRLTGGWRIRRESTGPSSVVVVPEPRPQPRFRSNLPLGPKLIGRDAALDLLRELLSAYRVITLTGPGGIGKTRLAAEVARGLAAGFQGDIWHVELVSLSDSSLVPSAVAATLGLEFGVERISAASVTQAIGRRKMLLLLDNCEHVIDAAAILAEAVMHRCPNATVLATSRELLRVDGEYAFRVPPLDVPPPGTRDTGEILRHSAVRLFIARTRSVRSDFTPRNDEPWAIGAICRRLDGIPLAIEIAASRAAALGIDQVISRLDNRFDSLTGGRRTALPRHQTLRATLDWSYDLLSETERRLLRRLAIFVAGFTLDTAEAVMSDATLPALSIEESIASLVAKSLISMDGAGDGALGPTRWRLLETTRAYARDKLVESGEVDHIARRHAEVFRDRVALVAFDSGSEPTAASRADHSLEIDNVRAALDWAFSPDGDAAIGVTLTAAYVPVWLRLSLVFECRERVGRALESVGPGSNVSARLIMRLHFALGVALTHTTPGSVERTGEVLSKALDVANRSGDIDSQLRALWAVWSFHYTGADFHAAEAVANRFCQVARKKGDNADILVGDRLIGSTLHYKGDQPRAGQHIERMLDGYVAPADQRHTTWFVMNQRVLARAVLARVMWMRGLIDQARHHAQVSLEEARPGGDELSLCYTLVEAVCPIQIMAGDFADADDSLRLLASVATKHGFSFWASMGQCLEGKLLIRRGELEHGIAQLRSALEGFRLADHLNFFSDLAAAMAGTGQLAEGLFAIDTALTRSERDDVRWCLAEALRVKGELLLQQAGVQSAAAAEGCFLGSLEVARRQGALCWELRAALSLARLRIAQDRPDEARRVLAPIHDRFTEGFDTIDLRQATALLESLPRDRGPPQP